MAREMRRRRAVTPIVRRTAVRTAVGVIIGPASSGVILSRSSQSSLPFISDIKVHLIWARYHFDSAAWSQDGEHREKAAVGIAQRWLWE